jgi:PfaD family protein
LINKGGLTLETPIVFGYLKDYELLDTNKSFKSLASDLEKRGVRSISVIKSTEGIGAAPKWSQLAIGGKLSGKKTKDAAPLLFKMPIVTAKNLGSPSFCRAYHTDYAYYAGSMANGISSEEMVITLGRAGYMGSYGSGGKSLEEVSLAIDNIAAALPRGPYLINLLHSPNNRSLDEKMVALFLEKSVRAIEVSAFISITSALVWYRLSGLTKDESQGWRAENKIIAKVSRDEVAEKFMSPPDPKIVEELLAKGLITTEQARWVKETPMADDVTAEADSGGHTDNMPLISLLPMMIALKDQMQSRYGYKQRLRIGAAGGIGTALAAAGAFQMGADYVVTGSVNQACVEADTSDYVKNMLAFTDMADVVMAPSADMFESGARVQVIKKGTMFPMNAQKLYDLYIRYNSLEELPDKEIKMLEGRLFHEDIGTVWTWVQEFFNRVDPSQIHRAASNAKYKMALIFRWYLGNSSRWAIKGDADRKMDMQIWCGRALGAFNKWVQGTELEPAENRTVVAVAGKIMNEAAYITMLNSFRHAGYDLEKGI